jgi:glycosyltransferase involved in cell wall biosynthesis
MAARAESAPWVIVAGGFHQHGGMDRANAALAACLLENGHRVHLVGHEIDQQLGAHRLATTHAIVRPRGAPALAERLLARTGASVARTVLAADSNARVVVNGGNCVWPDINWLHAVHAAWPVRDDGAPWWSRYRTRRLKRIAIERERTALRAARIVIANSDATRRAAIDRVGVARARAHTVYLGSDPDWGVPDAAERVAARDGLGVPPDVPVVLFVGALGNDINKGFDLLWQAWQALSRTGSWNARLIVAGGGWRASAWQRQAERLYPPGHVRFLGFTPHVRDVLAAGDLLVSPVRYEAYGLNVHEALCRGLAVMVTETAGVVERFDSTMSAALLPQGVTADGLADRLRVWRADIEDWRSRAAATAARLRARSWTAMASELVAVAQESQARAASA